jgi:hypothetical protein
MNFTTISLVIFKIFSSSLVIFAIPPHIKKPLPVGRRPISYTAEAPEVKENCVQHSSPRMVYIKVSF